MGRPMARITAARESPRLVTPQDSRAEVNPPPMGKRKVEASSAAGARSWREEVRLIDYLEEAEIKRRT